MLAMLGLGGPVLAAPPPPPPAAALLSAASTQAGKSGKTVFVGFHASWCGYCKRLHKILEQPEIRPIVDAHFEVVWLTVLERGDKKALENEGAMELLTRHSGGASPTLPFVALLDPQGKLLASSIGPRGNVGFPAVPHEVDHFVGMLKTAAPRLTAAELESLRKAFR